MFGLQATLVITEPRQRVRRCNIAQRKMQHEDEGMVDTNSHQSGGCCTVGRLWLHLPFSGKRYWQLPLSDQWDRSEGRRL